MTAALQTEVAPAHPRGSVAAFFLLALILSWAAWIPYAASRAGRLSLAVPAELIWLSEYGPSVAAILVTVWAEGRAGLAGLLRPLGRWRVPLRWYAFALLVTPALALLALEVQALRLGHQPDWSRLAGWDRRFIERTRAFSPSVGPIDGLVGFMSLGPVATAVGLVALAITNGGLSEEIGWRGYALPRLQARWGPLVASVVVGVLWGLWHTGTAFWQTVLTAGLAQGIEFAAGYVGRYLLLVVPLSLVYTWLWGETGSLLLVVLLHAGYNITVTLVTGSWPEFPLGYMVGLWWVVASGLALRLYRRSARSAPP